jgi:hypothetical protein
MEIRIKESSKMPAFTYQLDEVERDMIVYADWGLVHPHKALSTLDLQTGTEFGAAPLHSWSLAKLDRRLALPL